MLDRLRIFIKHTCVHFWRPRYVSKRGRLHCNNCHDRAHGGVWFFKSLGFK